MTGDDEFIRRLIGFGLSEKEAQTYLHLLKYGPKTPSPFAKSLHTYREDVHRTLTSLIEKGMARPSLDSPTVYTPVDLETALESALKKRESELREMEARKRQLQELSKQQRFQPTDDVSTFKIIKSIRELVSATITLTSAAKNGFLYVVPGEMLAIASLFGINAEAKKIVEQGGSIRGISDVRYADIAPAQEVLDIPEDLRHYDNYRGVYFAVVDSRHCVSAINVDINRIGLDEPISMLWTNDQTYADYLKATFEVLWRQSAPAEQRIQELLQQSPPKA
ncbi:MAG: TrmB family transcriptional regulator [Halobacteriota archaeon]